MKTIINDFKNECSKIINFLKKELVQIQAGGASPIIFEELDVNVYGSIVKLKTSASISVLDSSTISISPWDKFIIPNIEKAIRDSELNLNPLNDGSGALLIKIPPLTEEKRKELVKVVNSKIENAKISLRNVRHDFQHKIRQSEESDDFKKNEETKLQDEVNSINKEIDEIKKKKDDDLMKL